jgi:phosphopentomutase
VNRAVVIVLDSLGVGAAPDAAAFGDEGACTLGSIARWCAEQQRPLRIPHLLQLGLGHAVQAATGAWPSGLPQPPSVHAWHGAAAEVSKGKDTPSGHWEMMGCPVPFDWGYFPTRDQCPAEGSHVGVFPVALMNEWLQACQLGGSLCNDHASGTEVIARLGDEHVRTGWPICYTSADSVFQVAAHEEHFGLERLLHICEVAKPIFDRARIARVIARPFAGASGAYRRTGHRKDFTTPPPFETLLDRLTAHGREVHGVGKIGDIFAYRGVSQQYKADGNTALCAATLQALQACPAGGMVFANLVDFDTLYGHRRDVAGYADALEAFDAWLPQLLQQLGPTDCLAITADHGCDPTWTGSDHTREHVPLLITSPGVSGRVELGVRGSFADLGQTLARWLDVGTLPAGADCGFGQA